MIPWKNFLLDVKIKIAEWNMDRLKKQNELTRDYIEKQKNKALKHQKEIEKQKLLNEIKRNEYNRKQIYLEKIEKDLGYLEQENEALLEILDAMNEIDIEQIPSEWKRKLRNAIEKNEVLLIKEDFLRVLRSHTLYEHYE